MAGLLNSLGFDIFARDRATANMRAVGQSAKATAVSIEQAQIRVEKATRALTAAEIKHGKASLEARDAAAKLSKAQLGVESAMAKTQASTVKASAGVNAFKAVAGLAGAVVGTALFRIAKSAERTASDTNESLNKVQVVFGRSSASVVAFSKTSANAFGISKAAALEAAGTFGNLFTALKLPQAESAKMSVRLVKLAADLASFNNARPEDALEALRAGLVGEVEPLRRFGVNLQDATLRQEAMKLGLTTTTSQVLPPAIRAQAAYALILDQTKTAQGDFARTSDQQANAQRRAQARMSDLAGELGQKLLPIVRTGLVDVLNFSDALERNAGVIKPVAAGFAALAASILLVKVTSSGLDAARPKVSAFTTALSKAEGAGGKFRAGVGLIAGAIGPLNIALALAAVGVGIWAKKHQEAKQRAQELRDTLNQETGAITESTSALVAQRLEQDGVLRSAQKLGLSLADVESAALGSADAQKALNDQLKALQDSNPFGEISSSQYGDIQKVRGAVSGLSGDIKDQVEAQKRQIAAQGGAASSADDYATASKNAAKAQQDEKSAADKLRESLDKLQGKNISAQQSEINYRQSVADATQALKDNGKHLDLNSQKGRDNRRALLDLASAANDHLIAMVDDGASVATVTKASQTQRSEFIKVATQMGLNKTAAGKLADKLLEIPTSVQTDIGAHVSANIKSISFNDPVVRVGRPGHQHLARAAGGPIAGPGTETSDSIPAMLSTGEHVWTAREVRAAGGHGAVEGMRRSVLGGRFARGGPADLIGASRHGFPSLDAAAMRVAIVIARALGNIIGSYALPAAAGGGGSVRLGGLSAAERWIIMHESGGRTTAQNPTSTAFGLGQLLYANRVHYGRILGVSPNTTDYGAQLSMFRMYVRDRYGTAENAMRFWQAHGWYDDGGVATGAGWMPKRTRQPERVLSPRQTVAFEKLVRVMGQGGGAQVVNINLSAPNYLGSVADLTAALTREARGGRLGSLARELRAS